MTSNWRKRNIIPSGKQVSIVFITPCACEQWDIESSHQLQKLTDSSQMTVVWTQNKQRKTKTMTIGKQHKELNDEIG